MNLKHIQYVLAVLEKGSITGAAKKLYISQPSLSQMIRQVELSLGAPIFDRSTTPLTLTRAGELYLEAAHQVMEISSNLENEIAQLQRGDSGKIRFGIPVQRGMLVLPSVMSRFHQLYPAVDVEICEQGSDTLEKLVLDSSVDLACMTTIPRHGELNYIQVENEELMLLAAWDTDLAARVPDGTPISITEAKNETFVSNKPGHSIRVVQDSLFETYGIHPRILLESISIEVEKRVCLACRAVMICPKSYLSDLNTLQPNACVYPLVNTSSQRHCYICHRKDLRLPKYMSDFISILSEVEAPFLSGAVIGESGNPVSDGPHP